MKTSENLYKNPELYTIIAATNLEKFQYLINSYAQANPNHEFIKHESKEWSHSCIMKLLPDYKNEV